MFDPIIISIIILIRATLCASSENCPPDLDDMQSTCEKNIETTYPFDCPYEFPFKYPTDLTKPFWLSKRDENYGYFLNPISHKSLIVESGRKVRTESLLSDENCVIAGLYGKTILSNCTAKGVYGRCSYNPQDQQFCSQYAAICGSDCSGKSQYKSRFTCGAFYNESGESCEQCDKKFEEYPEPTVELHRQSDNLMRVVIRNPLKQAPELGNKDLFTGLFCYSKLEATDASSIWKRISLSEEQKKLYTNYTRIIEFSLSEEGVYYCEIFTYPNETLVQSEEVIVSFESHNFLVNVTVDMPVSEITYTLLIDQMKALSNMFKFDKDIMVEPMVLHPQVNGKNTIGFRVYTKPYETINYYYTKIKEALPSDYSMSTCEYCLEESLTIDDQKLTWPQSRIGMTVSTLELIVDENGFPITRSCLGTFKEGAFWADPQFNSSVTPSDITETLYNILMNQILTAEEINFELSEVIKTNPEIIPYDVHLIAKCLERIIDSGEEYNGKSVMKTIEATMKFNKDTLYLSQIKLNATDAILYAYDRIIQNQTPNDKHPVIIQTAETIVKVINIKGSSNGLAVYKTNRVLSIQLINVHNYSDIDKTDLMIASYFPIELIQEIKSILLDKEVIVASTVFLNNTLFNDEENRPNWQVMNIFVPGLKDPYFVNTFPVIFGERFETLNANQSCAYWDYGIDNQLVSCFGKWKQNGKMIIGDNYKVCYFNRLGHFALMFKTQGNIELNTATMTTALLLCILTFLIVIYF